jgi:hypothetical protein
MRMQLFNLVFMPMTQSSPIEHCLIVTFSPKVDRPRRLCSFFKKLESGLH